MEVLKGFNFKHPVLHIKTLSNGNVGVIDAQNALRIIDTATYKVIDGFKTNILHERYIGTYVDVTPDGEYSISALLGTNQAAIFSLSQRKLIYKVGRHQGEVECVGLDPNGRYFITGGQDGKSFVWVLKTSRLAFTLPPHSDYVSTVTFNDNGQWIATGSFDHTINLLNIATMNHPLKLRGHTSTIVKILFLPDAKLLSVDKEGGLIVWDMRNAKVIKRLQKMNDEVTSMCLSTSKRFVFVTTKLGYIGLYDMDTMEQVSSHYIKESTTITSVAFLSHPIRLAIGTLEGNLHFYSILGDEEIYAQMLREGEFKLFYAALEDNPMLSYSKAYDVAEKIWLDVIKKGRVYLEKNDRKKAKELFDPFIGIPKKNSQISQLLSSYEKYEQFQKCVQEGRLPLAYSLAKQYPAFQDSELYRKMEEKWKKLFFKAQELIISSNGDEKAKELLAPYRGISDKSVLIQQLFEDRKMYLYFKKTIAQYDYVKFFALVKKHPFLKEFSEYTNVMEYADKLYIQSQKAYAKGDFPTSRKACEVLVSFPDYSKEAQDMLDTLRIKHLFYEAISSNNLSNAFMYMSSFPLLYETSEAQALERQWNSAVDKGQKLAASGNPRETLAVFEPYFGIRSKYQAMAAVIAQSYCAQIEQKIRLHPSNDSIGLGIRQYVALFGVDEGIMSIVELFNKVSLIKMDLRSLRQGSLETWSPSNKIDDITLRV
ncbi:MAG: hypothetical protein JZU62_03750 [Sulfuricurvum sp.]|uniref:WD40 repeat domain-containing protein n=1 Tax=Sulfuricurvum sp. TaxID=2025608 RepID=UPI002600F5A3|nr:hypothetical protein [Sulfuricurvum sp.]MBV5320776.1 hypothetical protein [Sulfuricurvum sp.]